MRSKAAIFALFLCMTHQHAFAANEACSKRLPGELATALVHRFPAYRLPRENDNMAEDVRRTIESDGNGCLGVDFGNFYGDPGEQWIVALRSKRDAEAALVVVARKNPSGWHFDELLQWPSLASRLYVGHVPPGRYERGERDPLTGDEPEQLTCPHDAVALGATESSQINYCHIEGKWVSITVSE
jgi:hypothetical protein